MIRDFIEQQTTRFPESTDALLFPVLETRLTRHDHPKHHYILINKYFLHVMLPYKRGLSALFHNYTMNPAQRYKAESSKNNQFRRRQSQAIARPSMDELTHAIRINATI